MVAEVLAGLAVKNGGRYVDGTVGEGGHAVAILEAAGPRARLLGVDLDADALDVARERLAGYGPGATLEQGSFAQLGEIAARHGAAPADGVLLDLGVSSLQLETADRGFSFRREAPLDMRFDQRQGLTAHQVVNGYGERELADLIYRFGEERASRRVARAIVWSRPLETTTQLADVVARAVGRGARRGIHPATRTFQALRIAVNQELDNIRIGIEQAWDLLAPQGRLVVIAYHSLEDRLVKGALKAGAQEDGDSVDVTAARACRERVRFRVITRRVVRPSRAEVDGNPRSRSARLRAAERA